MKRQVVFLMAAALGSRVVQADQPVNPQTCGATKFFGQTG